MCYLQSQRWMFVQSDSSHGQYVVHAVVFSIVRNRNRIPTTPFMTLLIAVAFWSIELSHRTSLWFFAMSLTQLFLLENHCILRHKKWAMSETENGYIYNVLPLDSISHSVDRKLAVNRIWHFFPFTCKTSFFNDVTTRKHRLPKMLFINGFSLWLAVLLTVGRTSGN